MQIDFHYTAIYSLSRLAGFNQTDANTIAQSSQFVDDAVHSGIIFFDNRAAYRLHSAAHRIFDYRNFKELANHHVWIPFHFLPGNNHDVSLDHNASPFVQKIICRPNSEIAQRVMKCCFEAQDRKFNLQLLGISLHAYADTWAHQGFAGIDHLVNTVDGIYNWEGNSSDQHNKYIKKYYQLPLWKQFINWITSLWVNNTLPLGHGSVLSLPDRPYMRWQYKDWNGQMITRDNPRDYLEASEHIFAHLRRVKTDDWNCSDIKMLDEDRSQFQRLFSSITMDSGDDRYKTWIEEIRKGTFSFGTDTCAYQMPISGIAEIDSCENSIDQIFNDIKYSKQFLDSNWKKNYDAVTFYKTMVLHEVLPEFGICAA